MEARWEPYNRIARPLEAHGCDTAAKYEAYQREIIAKNREKRPTMNWRDPFEADSDGVIAIVSGGRWVVPCPACTSAPIFDPEWRIARCCQCGAIYRVSPPNGWIDAEAVLLARAEPSTRNWFPPSESLEDLVRQNLESGEPAGVPDAVSAPIAAALEAARVAQRVATDAPMVRSLTYTNADPVPTIEHDGAPATLADDAALFGSDFAAVLDELQATAEAAVAALSVDAPEVKS